MEELHSHLLNAFEKQKNISGKSIVQTIANLEGVSTKEAEELAQKCLKQGYIQSENAIRSFLRPNFSQRIGRYYRIIPVFFFPFSFVISS